jgi:hypothetical protein
MANKKKCLGMLGILLALGFVLGSCATTKLVDAGRYDATISESDEATLRIGELGGQPYSTMITRFDNQDVQWNGTQVASAFGFGRENYLFVIKVPAGAHTLTGMGAGMLGGTVKETSSKVNLEAGKTYNVAVVNGVVKTEEVK